MTVVGVRVDHRLIHAQILEAIVPKLKVNTILVGKNHTDELLENICRLCLPLGIKVKFSNVEKVAESILSSEREGDRLLVLFSSVGDAHRAYLNGFHFRNLNLGNVPKGQGKTRLTNTIFLTGQEHSKLKRLTDSGVTITLGLSLSTMRTREKGCAP